MKNKEKRRKMKIYICFVKFYKKCVDFLKPLCYNLRAMKKYYSEVKFYVNLYAKKGRYYP